MWLQLLYVKPLAGASMAMLILLIEQTGALEPNENVKKAEHLRTQSTLQMRGCRLNRLKWIVCKFAPENKAKKSL